MRISPCYGCDHRKPACHDSCSEYKKWHEEYRIHKEQTRNKPHPADAVRIASWYKKRKRDHHE